MLDLSLIEASGIIAFLLEGVADHNNLELGNEAVYGLNTLLRAIKNTMDQTVSESETEQQNAQ